MRLCLRLWLYLRLGLSGLCEVVVDLVVVEVGAEYKVFVRLCLRLWACPALS